MPEHVIARAVLDGVVVSTIRLDPERPGLVLDELLETIAPAVGATPEQFPYLGPEIPATEAAYESMVFPCDSTGAITDYAELACRRYMSEEDARVGHAELVAAWEMRVVH